MNFNWPDKMPANSGGTALNAVWADDMGKASVGSDNDFCGDELPEAQRANPLCPPIAQSVLCFD